MRQKNQQKKLTFKQTLKIEKSNLTFFINEFGDCLHTQYSDKLKELIIFPWQLYMIWYTQIVNKLGYHL